MGPVESGEESVALTPGRMQRWRAACLAHPMLTVLVIAALSASVSVYLVWTRRTLGTYDPDELGYLATALRYQRSVSIEQPLALWFEVRSTVLGPLVPMLSVPLLILGPRDPRTAMLVQPVFLIIAAVAVAGICRRVTTSGWAIVAGAYTAAISTVVLASQAYWYGLASATALAAAMWALLSSERLTNRWTWAYGLCIGLMLLTRTMTLGFLPGLVLAGLVLAWGDRRRVLRLGSALLLALIVAGPWWWERRSDIFGYLFSYGFGPEAAEWGSGNLWERLGDRLADISSALLFGLRGWGVAALAVLGSWTLLAIARRERRPWHWTDRRRDAAAIAIVVVVGIASLASTTNAGVWFELPIVLVAIAFLAVMAERSHPAVQLAALLAVAVAMAMVPISMTSDRTSHADEAFAASDPRFVSADLDDRSSAKEQWWDLTERVTDELARLSDDGANGAIAMTGNTFLMNSNSITLAAELDGWNPRVEVPQAFSVETMDPPPSPSAWEVGANGRPKERLLVVVRHELPLFTPDFQWREYERRARQHGWVEVWQEKLPVPGSVSILRHPDAGAPSAPGDTGGA